MKSTFVVFILKALGALGSLLFAFLVSLYATEELSSKLFQYFSVISLIGVGIRYGSEVAILKIVSPIVCEDDNRKLDILMFSFLISISLSVVFFIVSFVLLNSALDFSFSEVFACNLVSITWSFFYILGNFLQSAGDRINPIILMNLILPVAFLSSFSVTLSEGFDSLTILWIAFLFVAVFGGGCVFNALNRLRKLFFVGTGSWVGFKNKDWYPDYMKVSKNTFLGGFSQQIIQWLSPLIAAFYFSDKIVSDYFLLHRVIFAVGFFLVVANFQIFPVISRMIALGELGNAAIYASRRNRIVFLVGGIYILFISFFGVELLALIGKDIDLGGWVIAWLSVGQIFNLLSGSVPGLLNFSGNSDVVRNGNIMSAIICVFFGIIFSDIFGIFGLSFSVGMGVVFLNVYQIYICHKRVDIFYTSLGVRL